MHKQSKIYQWVENLANQGTWESEGRFTLDRDKAWEKLSTYQLPFEHAWVLKLVQAAVLAACESLQVKLTGSESSFRFVGQSRWTQDLVTAALFSADSAQDMALVPLAAAVRYLARSADKLLALRYPDGTTQVWDGEAFHSETSPYPVDCFELTVFSARKSGSFWSLGASGLIDAAMIGKVLSNLAYPCPIPITLDGRPINGFSNDPNGGATSHTAPVALLPVNPTLHLPEFRFLRDRDWRPEKDELSARLDGELMTVFGEAMVCGALACFTANIQETVESPGFCAQPSYLKWVKDGVIIRAEKLESRGSIGLTLLISAEGLRTDLSGLNLSLSNLYEERKRHARARIREKLFALADKDTGRRLTLGMKGTPQKVALLTFTGLSLVNPLFLGLAGVAAAQYASDKLRLKRREFQLQDDFERLCTEF